MEAAFGIDLGTTNSCIAVIGEDGLPQVIKNLDDEFTTPSVVCYEDDGECYVGVEAKRSMNVEYDRIVAFIKREMSNEKYDRKIDDIEITPVATSALILKKVVDDANEQRRMEGLPEIHKAVVTVPAYFGNMECELTKQAGQIAGLEVLDLLNEPTAAALSYGVKGLEGKTFMIYDLGGGTFDVSIMRMKNGVLDTLATDGDQHLGGIDWDIALLDYLLMSNDLGITYEDIKKESDTGKMLNQVEICKKNLSKSDKVSYKFKYNRKQFTGDISRSVFEELTEDLLERTIDIIHHAQKISREPDVKIDEIILVGGSSYMPMIKKKLQKEFSCPIRLDNLEPDRAVAKGAAIHAANILGSTKSKVKIGTDLASRSYGVRCISPEGKLHVWNIIKRTDDLVYEGKYSGFCTSDDNQTSVIIAIYENISEKDSMDVDKCTLIEEKVLSWGFPVPKGTTVYSFVSRNSDGTVRIWLECQNKKVDFEIKYRGMYSEDEVERMRKDLSGKRV
ncbi:Hsp70 family protein [Bacteroides caecigallinarum]|uniref:Hsp70 family protein n=1 Tax=Bacteroides caecigallinarum TaxID=1411144 RepID=UPI00195E68B0|nr:Hsp70 family protein [Bacteroides caecigallinarum]MBM6865536.1 Hsp70 family protein [Bacteroides caecigallinarum]